LRSEEKPGTAPCTGDARISRKPLTDASIRTAKPKAKRYRMSDGHGLAIEVSPAGGKYWRYRYEMAGREYLYALGEWATAPDGETAEQAAARRAAGRFTLAEARFERQRCRDMVKLGQHPLAARKAQQQASRHNAANTFEAVAAEFIEKRGSEWGDSHRARFTAFLENDARPEIGALPIADVPAATVLAILRKVEARGSLSMATEGRSIIGQVFRYGMATGRCSSDPTAAMRGALETRVVRHHAPLERAEMPAFFKALTETEMDRPTAIAVLVLAYLFVRPGELRGAQWSEIDLDAAEWRIPGERMKMGSPHAVPLPSQAVDLLRQLHALTGHTPWLFPHSQRPRDCMAEGTLGRALDRVIERAGIGKRFTPHGFRATASTMLHETGTESRLIELQLAHQDRNASRASYDHSARLPERRAMMQSYADMLDAMAQPNGNVVLLHSAK
jgi:integrase